MDGSAQEESTLVAIQKKIIDELIMVLSTNNQTFGEEISKLKVEVKRLQQQILQNDETASSKIDAVRHELGKEIQELKQQMMKTQQLQLGQPTIDDDDDDKEAHAAKRKQQQPQEQQQPTITNDTDLQPNNNTAKKARVEVAIQPRPSQKPTIAIPTTMPTIAIPTSLATIAIPTTTTTATTPPAPATPTTTTTTTTTPTTPTPTIPTPTATTAKEKEEGEDSTLQALQSQIDEHKKAIAKLKTTLHTGEVITNLKPSMIPIIALEKTFVECGDRLCISNCGRVIRHRPVHQQPMSSPTSKKNSVLGATALLQGDMSKGVYYAEFVFQRNHNTPKHEFWDVCFGILSSDRKQPTLNYILYGLPGAYCFSMRSACAYKNNPKGRSKHTRMYTIPVMQPMEQICQLQGATDTIVTVGILYNVDEQRIQFSCNAVKSEMLFVTPTPTFTSSVVTPSPSSEHTKPQDYRFAVSMHGSSMTSITVSKFQKWK